ncbi:MAG: peptidase S9, prolyl oligopeptidase [Acidobacteria bacterium]|nr:MAG: peptidase S9, prolyl oligopeptidase [Acidobacteriota bacterium]
MFSSSYSPRLSGYGSFSSHSIVAFLALLLSISQASAQSDVITPGKNIEAIGVPPVPASLARELSPYSSVYGLPLAGWDFEKHEILLKGISNTTWISRVSSPGAKALPTLIYLPSNGIYDVYFQPQGKYLAYTRDAGGNETFQLYLYQIGRVQSTMLSDGKSRNTEPVWSNAGDKIIYSSTPVGDSGVNLRLIDPFNPTSDHLIAKSSGSYFKAYDWSPDDRQIVFCDFTSNTSSTLWVIDVASGNKTLISPKSDQPEYYDYPQFSKDGKAIYAVTDHDSDIRRIAHIDLASRKVSYVPSNPKWDVDEFQLSPNGKTLAYVTNEEGVSRLHVFDVSANKELSDPEAPIGVISDLKWNKNSTDLAFNFKSCRTVNDVYSVDVKTGKVELWGKSVTNGVDTDSFSLPELIHWITFDKRSISGFLYRPPAKFKGKRPVIIDIHGGPEEQYRPVFGYEDNYFLNELGVVKIFPNVRGSSGYGKAFLALDNGTRREDAVKDIGSLIDWIKTQPELDADRVMVEGASYGGYLTLSTAYAYSDRIRGAISESGITNLASFVANTEGWRRELQRSEFGDERDPKIKEFLARIAPLNNAQKIKKPLLIIHGQNDPRVPVAEAAALVAATKDRIPVWFILAKDEGHGLVQQNNRNYRLYASILFVKEFLLK